MVAQKLPAGPQNPLKICPGHLFPTLQASWKSDRKRFSIKLHSDPHRSSKYGVLCTQNVTFQLSTLTPKTYKKMSAGLPFGTLNAHNLTENAENWVSEPH